LPKGEERPRRLRPGAGFSVAQTRRSPLGSGPRLLST
jgi:hypothetical protein